ncbi:endonuclease III domain-containing protein [candidate division KSB1 bacterium]
MLDVITLKKVIEILKKEYRNFREPIVTEIAEIDRDPYKVLIGCILSLRTKDAVTAAASEKLFKIASTPEKIIKLTPEKIVELIYPVGFYNTKAKNIIKVSEIILGKYGGKVPDDLDELLTLPNVGRKTANLVLTVGYRKPGICVDTHVHRISNRFGFVKTKNPVETEFALRKKLPQQYWIVYNDLLVSYGQNLCKPVSPFCSKCKINKLCEKIGLERSR